MQYSTSLRPLILVAAVPWPCQDSPSAIAFRPDLLRKDSILAYLAARYGSLVSLFLARHRSRLPVCR